MLDRQRHSTPSAQSDEALRLVCTEVWGGNRPIDTPIELPGVRGHIFSQPCAGGRGGDIHYLSVCSSGLISRICLADVAGHGEPVATVSTEIHRLLSSHMNWFDQRTVLKKLNRRLMEIGFDALTTAAIATYFPPWRRLSISYAGHPPAWFYSHAADRWQPLPTEHPRRGLADLPLAADGTTRFTRKTVKVQHGDRLLLVTDGVLEAHGPDREHFGADRLERLLNENGSTNTYDLVNGIVAAVRDHARDENLAHDDVSLLMTEFVPGPPGPTLWQIVKNRALRPRGNSHDPRFAP